MIARPLLALAAAAPLACGMQLELFEVTEVAAVPPAPTLTAPSKQRVGSPGPHLEYVLPTPPVNVTLTPVTAHVRLGQLTPVITHDPPMQLELF